MYESEGKQAFRELLLSLARHAGCQTYGTFWGTGIDSRLFAAEGFDVVSAEVVRAKYDAMDMDAATGGYRAFHGRAGKLAERFDMFHADFDGGPSPANFREVRRIAAITNKWLAVTLSMDHQRDELMMGEAAFGTVPAWLTYAAGFTLEYLGRYKRNKYGQMMWVALLRPGGGKGTAHQVLPVQISYSIGERGYWSSRRFYEFGLLPHRYSPRNEREKRADRSRYLGKRVQRDVSCVDCGVFIGKAHGNRKHCKPCGLAIKARLHADWYQRVGKFRSIMARPEEPSKAA